MMISCNRVMALDQSAINKKEFQEAKTKLPKVRHGGSGNSAAFLCILCSWLLNIPYQSYCGDRACYVQLPEATGAEDEAEMGEQSHIGELCSYNSWGNRRSAR